MGTQSAVGAVTVAAPTANEGVAAARNEGQLTCETVVLGVEAPVDAREAVVTGEEGGNRISAAVTREAKLRRSMHVR